MTIKNLTPLKAIRQHCLECSNYQPKEVRLCPSYEYPLFKFRMGKNPNIKRKMTEEQKKVATDRLKKYNSK